MLDTGASRTVSGNTMIQRVLDSLFRQQTPARMELAEPAGTLHFCGTRTGTIWHESVSSAAGRRLRTVLCQRGSEATPILFGLDMIRNVVS